MKLLWLAMFLVAGSASASTSGKGVYFNPTVFYTELEVDEDNDKTTSERTVLDMNLGYSLGAFMFGGKYYSSKEEIGDSLEISTSAVGITAGFEHKMLKLFAAYMVVGPELDITFDETEWEYTKGSGTLFEASLIAEFGKWGVGPKVAYSAFSYDKLSVNGTNQSDFEGREETEILPFLSLYFKI